MIQSSCACKLMTPVIHLLNRVEPLWWLLLRLWIASVFFKSGLTKIDDFDTTILLFTDEYHVPILSPYMAAISATFFELAMPVALVLGLGVRAAAVPLLVMTAVIQFTYLQHEQHYYWATVLIGLILHGGGKVSLDYWLQRFYARKP